MMSQGTAVLSPCGKYRYRLEREVGMEGKVFAYFGINPSTADASLDDATVRKWIGFTKVFGGRRLIVGNVFAFRATDVQMLVNDPLPLGSIENREHLLRIAADADVLVPCWGSRRKVPPYAQHHLDNVMGLLQRTGKPIMTFGRTKSGDPKHPLMLGYKTPLTFWEEET